MGPKCWACTSYAMSCPTPVSPQNTHSIKRDLAGLVHGVCQKTGPQSMSVGQTEQPDDSRWSPGKGHTVVPWQGARIWPHRTCGAATWKGTRWVCFHQLPTEIEKSFTYQRGRQGPGVWCFVYLFEQCQQQKPQMLSYQVAVFSKYHSCSSLLLNYGHYLASCCWIIFNVLIEAHTCVS